MVGSVVGLDEGVGRPAVQLVGGKAAHLGELSGIQGIGVPAGFCVTTEVYRRVVAGEPSLGALFDRLSRVDTPGREELSDLSPEIRDVIEAATIPAADASAITDRLTALGADDAYAVRSSATAEDLPTVSFAGQQDSYLNVVGQEAVLEHVRRCWASLFTERAIAYRIANGIDHRDVAMAVVVQRMVHPQASGVLFTADPVTGNRTATRVEATYGLGEPLVSGRVAGDSYEVRDGEVVGRTITVKPVALHAAPTGGTEERAIEPGPAGQAALTDEQVVRLARIGRRIEAYLGSPQDIEWCLADGEVHIVQSRPITTLFPIPDADDDGYHVYVSVGHQQMMTEPMRPLGLSVWRLTSPAPMREAGGRLFVDVTQALASAATRGGLVAGLGRSDPLIGDALQAIVDRGDLDREFLDQDAGGSPAGAPAGGGRQAGGGAPSPIETDTTIVAELISGSQESLASLQREIRTLSGAALIDFVVADLQRMQQGILFEPRSRQAVMAGMEAAWWLNDHLESWLGEKNAADVLTRSAPDNITSQMGLALMAVADTIRPHPQVVAFLEQVGDDEDLLDGLSALPGGQDARDAIERYLDEYGMRCVGEIDITRPRWSERPAALVPMILSNVRTFEAGAGERRFERGRQEAAAKRQELLARLRDLPDGERKADEVDRMIDRVRTFIGYREYPKYHMVSRYLVYRRALLAEADRLVRDGVLREVEDAFYLTLEEVREVVRDRRVDHELVRARRDASRSFAALTPPRVLTSDGEALAGAYRRTDVPTEALIGLPVSAGTIEGRARVVSDVGQADLEPGDILVTSFTDPSWTPVFVAIAGLVTEVGGLMTHGAVIAREYGVPAVVGVQDATQLIEDGRRIRVNATDGYVELLS